MSEKCEDILSDYDKKERERIKRSNDLWATRTAMPCIETVNKKKIRYGRGAPILEGRQY